MPASGNAEAHWPNLSRHSNHRRRIISPSRCQRDEHRSAEPWTRSHHKAQLAAAARRKSDRFPVSWSRVADRLTVNPLPPLNCSPISSPATDEKATDAKRPAYDWHTVELNDDSIRLSMSDSDRFWSRKAGGAWIACQRAQLQAGAGCK